VKALIAMFLVAALCLVIACDRYYTIRQMPSGGKTSAEAAAANPNVHIQVEPKAMFGGRQSYRSKVVIGNSSDKQLTVTSVELVTNGTTYATKSGEARASPLSVPAGGSETIDFDFDLNAYPSEMLPHPAELRIHYRTGGQDWVASAVLEEISGYHQPHSAETAN
jgi:hypothetical protein